MLEVVARGGTIRSEPPGIACPQECSADFAADAVVRLDAAAADGFRFAGWEGACAGSAEAACELELSRDTTVVARFEPLPGEVELQVAPPEGGRIASRPAGIDCPDRCVASFAPGTAVELTATADPDYELGAWTGACEGTEGPTCSLVLRGAFGRSPLRPGPGHGRPHGDRGRGRHGHEPAAADLVPRDVLGPVRRGDAGDARRGARRGVRSRGADGRLRRHDRPGMPAHAGRLRRGRRALRAGGDRRRPAHGGSVAPSAGSR